MSKSADFQLPAALYENLTLRAVECPVTEPEPLRQLLTPNPIACKYIWVTARYCMVGYWITSQILMLVTYSYVLQGPWV